MISILQKSLRSCITLFACFFFITYYDHNIVVQGSSYLHGNQVPILSVKKSKPCYPDQGGTDFYYHHGNECTNTIKLLLIFTIDVYVFTQFSVQLKDWNLGTRGFTIFSQPNNGSWLSFSSSTLNLGDMRKGIKPPDEILYQKLVCYCSWLFDVIWLEITETQSWMFSKI